MNRVVVGAGIAGLVIGAVGTFAGIQAVGDDDPMPYGRMSRMESSGQMHQMMSDHADMLTEMRGQMTPQMRDQMNDDPMARMMMSGQMLEMMQEHQDEMTTMMGRGNR